MLTRPSLAFDRAVELIRVIDGDTLDVWIDNGWDNRMREHIRLEGLDTPEPRGVNRAAGDWVTSQVNEQVWERIKSGGQQTIRSLAYSRAGKVEGKYGRTLATYWIDDWCCNQWLLEQGLAWFPHQERNLALLSGLPSDVIALCQ